MKIKINLLRDIKYIKRLKRDFALPKPRRSKKHLAAALFSIVAVTVGIGWMANMFVNADGWTLDSVEGDQITSTNNPGGFTNSTPSVSPDNGTNFSPAFGSSVGSATKTISINGSGFPDPNTDLTEIDAKDVQMGYYFGCYLSNDNWVYCWGNNSSGQLGDGTTVNRATPVPVSQGQMVDSEIIIDYSVGNDFVCVITNMHNIYCWGGNFNRTPTQISNGQMPSGQYFKKINAGYRYICGISNTDTLYCWSSANTPIKIKTISGGGVMPNLVKQVSVGSSSPYYVCAIASDDMVYCWGGNAYGQLGNNTTASSADPTPVYGMLGESFIQVETLARSTCALKVNGQMYCWGDNYSGLLGNGTTDDSVVPTPVTQNDGLLFESIGNFNQTHSYYFTYNYGLVCAISTSNEPYCWGSGYIGDGTTGQKLLPTRVKTVSNGGIMPDAVKQISTQNAYDSSNAYISACAVADNSKVYCWGYSSSSYAMMGNNTISSSANPVQVKRFNKALPEITFNQYGSSCYSVIIVSSSKLSCYNSLGQDLYDVVVTYDGQTQILQDAYYRRTKGLPSENFSGVGRHESAHLTWDWFPEKPYYPTLEFSIACKRSDSSTWVSAKGSSCDSGKSAGDSALSTYDTVSEHAVDVVGLTNGVSYDFRMISNNSTLVYTYGIVPQASTYVPSRPEVASAVTSSCSIAYTGASYYNCRLQATITPPTSDGGSPIIGYKLLYQRPGDNYVSALYALQNYGSSINIGSSFDMYFTNPTKISIIAINANGASQPSEEILLYPPDPDDPKTPDKVRNIKVNNVDTDKVMLSWSQTNGNGYAITSYEMRYSLDSTFNSGVSTCISNTGSPITPSCTTPSLTLGSLYYVQVRAVNANGAGAWSAVYGAIVGAPDRPVISSFSAGDGTATLTWNVPNNNGAAINGYTLERSTSPDFEASQTNTSNLNSTWITSNCDSSTCTYNDSGLTNGTVYYYRVTASNSRGDSPASDPVSTMPYRAPTIISVSPASGLTTGHQTITIAGEDFNSATSVTIDGNECVTFSVVDINTITCLTPAGTVGAKAVAVTNLGGTDSKSGAFTYVPAPGISQVVPNKGPTTGGTAIALTGTGFNGVTSVKIGDKDCASFNVVSDVVIDCVTPDSNAGTYNITLTKPEGSVTGIDLYTYVTPPTITSVSPIDGMTSGGTLITVTGTDFNNVTDFKIGGQACTTFTWVSGTSVTCVVPAYSAGLVDVYIATDGGGDFTKEDAFTYIEPVIIDSVTPNSGPTGGGTEVTITGTNFTGSPTIKFGSAVCNVTDLSDGTITCKTSVHAAGTYDMTYRAATQLVTINNAFTYIAPTITSATPTSGPTGGGTEITITGTNFGSASSIKLDNKNCIGVTITVTQITCRTQSHPAGLVDLVYSDEIETIARTNAFEYLSPTITDVTPTSGPTGGGTEVIITGTNFGGAPTIRLGGSVCRRTDITATTITCETGRHLADLVDLELNDGGEAVTINDAFTYIAPSITSVTPNHGLTDGGTEITIDGSGFSSSVTTGNMMGVFSQDKYYYIDMGGNLIAGDDQGEIQIDTSAMTSGIEKLISGDTVMSAYIKELVRMYGDQLGVDAQVTISPLAVLGKDGTVYLLNSDGSSLDAFTIDGASSVVDIDFYLLITDANEYGLMIIQAFGFQNSIVGSLLDDNNQVYGFEINATNNTTIFNPVNMTGVSCELSRLMGMDLLSSSNLVALCSDNSTAYAWSDTNLPPQELDLSDVDGYIKSAIFDTGTSTLTVFTDDNMYSIGQDGTQNVLDNIDLDGIDIDYIATVGYGTTPIALLVVDKDGALYFPGEDGLEPAGIPDFPHSYGRLSSVVVSIMSMILGVVEKFIMITDMGAVYELGVTTDSEGVLVPTTDYELYYTATNVDTTGSSTSGNVKLDSSGTSADCAVDSWTDTQIVCTTSAHLAGLVNVAVNNGTYNSAVMPAQYINSSSNLTDPTNVASGFLYQESQVSLALDTNNVKIGGSSGLSPTSSGAFGFGTNVVTATTNNLDGYTLKLSTNLPDSNPNAKDMKHDSLNNFITGTSNTCTWDGGFKILTNTTTALSNNTWGFTLNTTDRDSQKLCQVPSQTSPLTIKSTTTDNEIGDVTDVYYGTKIDYNQAAGKYQTTVVYTAVANI
ncbi:MAG: IPT/TIG domain-containing protein [Candidatus Nomurabacteria bacterium]|nr:IPT/TIG domain-containing protein [Candidatus Nomurabacteria bacterium]